MKSVQIPGDIPADHMAVAVALLQQYNPEVDNAKAHVIDIARALGGLPAIGVSARAILRSSG